MKLIEKYIFQKAGFSALIVLGALVGVIWVVQALRELDVITSNGQTIVTYLTITLLLVPNLALAIIPVALMLAAIHTINTMNANSELVVVAASGSSNWTLAKPLILLAFLCSLFTGLVAHVVSPLSLQHVRGLVTEMRADLVSVILREGTFNTVEKGLTFHVAERGAAGLLSGILISDDRDPAMSSIFSAKEGVVLRVPAGSFLALKDGEIQQTDRRQGQTTFIKYQSYAFDLSSFSGKADSGNLRPKERTTLDLLTPDPNDPIYQSNPGQFRKELHERIAEMLWPFANVFIILAFAGHARSNRQSFATSIMAAAVTLIAMRGIGFSAVSALKSDPGAVIYVYGLPLSCIVFGLYHIAKNQPVMLPAAASRKIEEAGIAISKRNEAMLEAYKQFRRRMAGVTG